MTDRQKAEERLAKELGIKTALNGAHWVPGKFSGVSLVPEKVYEALVSRELELEKLRLAHTSMHEYLKEIGDSNCELCEALERIALPEAPKEGL